jgi:voltage-gated potassium channel
VTALSAPARTHSLRARVYNTIEAADHRSPHARIFRWALIGLIVVNVIAAILESVPEILADDRIVFRVVENFSLVAFSLEYVVRLWVAVEHPRYRGMPAWRARLTYAATPEALIDLVALAPFVAMHVFGLNLRVIILLRFLRLFKLARYSTGFLSLFEAMRRERHALLACLVILASVVMIAASLMYAVERDRQPDAFGTIPDAMWWAVTTVTTVGYGDVVPRSGIGRVIGGITMIGGILMLALPVAIIATSFAEVIRQRSFLVTYGMLARLPLFAELPADDLIEILPELRAVTAESGTLVVEPGGDWTALYVIAEGAVELDCAHERHRLESGEAFGGVTYLHHFADARMARARSRSRLLVLDGADLDRLMESRPEFATRLNSGA